MCFCLFSFFFFVLIFCVFLPLFRNITAVIWYQINYKTLRKIPYSHPAQHVVKYNQRGGGGEREKKKERKEETLRS